MVSKLSGTTKNLTAGLMSDPQKMENLISMVRTVVPLTSAQTVTKVNTYLPLFEKVSTLLGMYSFLNRAQTFRPIEPLNAKTPQDMVAALMKNGNIPVGKMLAQPLIANNMEKMMGAVATNMLKNGGLNEILKNVNINDMLKNENLGDMLSAFNKTPGKNSSDNNIDLNSLMETFMPIISSMSSGSLNDMSDDNDYEDDRSSSNHFDTPKRIELINENNLPGEESENSDNEKYSEEFTYDDQYDKYDKIKKDRYDKSYKKERYDNYEKAVNYNEHKNNYSDQKDNQRPIRIKQRKRR